MFWQVCTLPAKDAFHLSLSHFVTNTSARASRTLTTVFLPVHKLRILEDRRGVLVDGSTSVLVPNSTRTPGTRKYFSNRLSVENWNWFNQVKSAFPRYSYQDAGHECSCSQFQGMLQGTVE